MNDLRFEWTVERHLRDKPPAVVDLYRRFVELVESVARSTTRSPRRRSPSRAAGVGLLAPSRPVAPLTGIWTCSGAWRTRGSAVLRPTPSACSCTSFASAHPSNSTRSSPAGCGRRTWSARAAISGSRPTPRPTVACRAVVLPERAGAPGDGCPARPAPAGACPLRLGGALCLVANADQEDWWMTSSIAATTVSEALFRICNGGLATRVGATGQPRPPGLAVIAAYRHVHPLPPGVRGFPVAAVPAGGIAVGAAPQWPSARPAT